MNPNTDRIVLTVLILATWLVFVVRMFDYLDCSTATPC